MIFSTFHIFLLVCVIILRLLVALHPHSGQDNYHGSKTSYGGDYEAQRHWMELTLHVPLREWYTHDVQYWGLDYPPLTAYVSYLCGYVSHSLVGAESVALYTSRYGTLETPTLLYTDTTYTNIRSIQYTHKAFMRLTVVFLEIVIFFTIVVILAKRLSVITTITTTNRIMFRFILLSTLMQPSLILIDHGHFQYNNVCLGLSLWAIHYMTQSMTQFYPSCLMGSIFFCLALNFKQMTLYYAPAIFFYLLGRCFNHPIRHVGLVNNRPLSFYVQTLTISMKRIFMLGISVLFTFFILWYPFVYYRDSSTTTVVESIFTIVQRLFPFQRGMFEGKVANIWCTLSIRPISIRSRIPTQYQPLAALIVTSILIVPFCIVLFYLGLSVPLIEQPTNTTNLSRQHVKTLLWGCTGTALSFFLASFQVHEKSILLAMTPASLFICEYPSFILWLSGVAVWSMWHLLNVDRLSIAYSACGLLFYVILLPVLQLEKIENRPRQTDIWNVLGSYASFGRRWMYMIFISTIILMILLHVAELVYIPPSHMPDLFPMIWSITGCAMFCISWIITFLCCYQSMNEARRLSSITRDKID